MGVVGRNRLAERFKPLLRRGVLVATALAEVAYKLQENAKTPPESTAAFLRSQGVTVEPFSPAAALHVPSLRAVDAKSVAAQEAANEPDIKALSFADLCCLAHALERGLPVLTGDRHWSTLGPYGLAVPVYDFHDQSVQL